MGKLGIGKRDNHEIARQPESQPKRKYASSEKRGFHS